MPIYKQTTEITNIDDLLSSVERDIEEVYFGDKNVFTVWAEYDGALPAQYTANGNYLADYRIYGASGGVGDRTKNLWNVPLVQGAWRASDGIWLAGNAGYVSSTSKISVDAEATYSFVFTIAATVSANRQYAYFWGDNNAYLGYQDILLNPVIHTPSNATHIAVSIGTTAPSGITPQDVSNVMLTEGSTAPAEYVPYGYAVPISVSDGTTSTTTQIYVGSEPLGEDEYVDYGSGKIYRMVNGVLTPTDPPVPLPALPTVDGTNIVDYAGQSAAPSRFYAKYRKQNF